MHRTFSQPDQKWNKEAPIYLSNIFISFFATGLFYPLAPDPPLVTGKMVNGKICTLAVTLRVYKITWGLLIVMCIFWQKIKAYLIYMASPFSYFFCFMLQKDVKDCYIIRKVSVLQEYNPLVAQLKCEMFQQFPRSMPKTNQCQSMVICNYLDLALVCIDWHTLGIFMGPEVLEY